MTSCDGSALKTACQEYGLGTSGGVSAGSHRKPPLRQAARRSIRLGWAIKGNKNPVASIKRDKAMSEHKTITDAELAEMKFYSIGGSSHELHLRRCITEIEAQRREIKQFKITLSITVAALRAAEAWDLEAGKLETGEGEYRPYLLTVLAEKLSEELGRLRLLES